MAFSVVRTYAKLQVSHSVTLSSLLLTLLCLRGVRPQSPFSPVYTVTPTLRMDIVINRSPTFPSDYGVLAPAIDLALERAKRDFNIIIEPLVGSYLSNCTDDGLEGLTQIIRAMDHAVDVMLGPACTADLILAAKLTTVSRMPLMTGAGSFVDSTAAWPYMARTGYNTMTQWTFFLLMLGRFGWKNVAVYYESDGFSNALNGQSTYNTTYDTRYSH